VFAPHHAEDAQFSERRLAVQSILDLLEFLWSNSVVFQNSGRDRRGLSCRHGGKIIFARLYPEPLAITFLIYTISQLRYAFGKIQEQTE
jgi:hypothetical protein